MDELNIKPLIDDINAVLFSTLQRINLGNSDLAKSVKIVFENGSFKIKFSDYAHFIDSGRRAGAKPPPVKAIMTWISKNGISPKNITTTQLAYAISRSIGIKGIKSKPFLDRLSEEVTELIEIHIFEEINKLLIKELKTV